MIGEKPELSGHHQIDYSRKWYVMVAVGMGVFLATVDGSIVNVALPTIVSAFSTQFATVQWVVLSYLLTVTTLMLGVGRFADMVGKKPIYSAGFLVFTVGSLLCGLSPSIDFLIASRVFQAVGAAMVMSLGLAIVTESFPPAERGKAIGVSGAVVSVGIVIGPTLGGLLINRFSWHWIFYVNLPVGIVGTILALRFVPSLRPRGGQRFDFLGAVLMFSALLSLLLALTLGQGRGFTDPLVLILLFAWLILQTAFVAVEMRIEQPMIDLRLLRNRLFSINLVTGFLTFICLAGTLILMPFYLQNILGYNPQEVGLLLATVPVVLAIFAPLSGTLSDRYGSRSITAIGLLVIAVGYISLSSLDGQTSAAGFILRFLPIGIGMGIFQSPNNSAIMGTSPRSQLGVVSGLLAVNRTLGQTTGIAILGAIWATRVFQYEGMFLPSGATSASTGAQLFALQDAFLINAVVIGSAFLLSVWAVFEERRQRKQQIPVDRLPE